MTAGGPAGTLILGIGNVLMGDEGVGVRVVEHLETLPLPEGVTVLDGGTAGLALLEPIQSAARVILVDATVDGRATGTVRRLRPKYSNDYPPTLVAHDIGLKDLLDVLGLTGAPRDVTLFAVSIEQPTEVEVGLSEDLKARVPAIAEQVLAELGVASGVRGPGD